MPIQPAKRISAIGHYAFAEVDAQVSLLKQQGIEPIDFGVGDPTLPTPEAVRDACKAGVDRHARSGYPSYAGSPSFRAAAAAWVHRRFGVKLDPETEICATLGSKEAVFHLHEGFVNPGDLVLQPTPGYPPYHRGTLFAEGVPYFYPLTAENRFLPDFDRIPANVLKRARLLWLCYPNNPTGAVADDPFWKQAVSFARKHGLLLASDEAYADQYYTDVPPRSALEFAKEGTIAFFSLSKRSAMTGYRVGFAAGDPKVIEVFKKVKTNIDSGTPLFIQEAAGAAWADETHVAQARAEYRKKRDILIEALTSIGLPDCTPEATLYVWQSIPKGMSSVEFAKRLLDPKIALVTTPGSWLSQPLPDLPAEAAQAGSTNPGEGYVRFALVPSPEETEEAARRIRILKF
jgi:LL-diaminopimelate aminotransferase